MAADGLDEERQETAVFFVTREIAQGLAEVPVRSVKDPEI
ncbi:MAG: hypothetical protein DVB23_000280 [Verrucomicrobia bacterium]|jgi:hypothetical protein|nr:MAG: hypothetical protein DVB23_000280 [Verrucomicrobiota bacterium]